MGHISHRSLGLPGSPPVRGDESLGRKGVSCGKKCQLFRAWYQAEPSLQGGNGTGSLMLSFDKLTF